jgi:hypothetical protein
MAILEAISDSSKEVLHVLSSFSESSVAVMPHSTPVGAAARLSLYLLYRFLSSGMASDTEAQKNPVAPSFSSSLARVQQHDGSAQVSLSPPQPRLTLSPEGKCAVASPAKMKKGKQREGGGPNKAKALSAASSGSPSSGSTASSAPRPTTTLEEEPMPLEELEFGEEIITFDSPIHAYDPTETALAMAGGSSSSNSHQQSGVKKKKSIKSETSVELKGPMEVDGSVKSMGAVTFTGDFSVRDRIEAYGDIDINGNLSCR